jgi:gliding motility-associated-like protein
MKTLHFLLLFILVSQFQILAQSTQFPGFSSNNIFQTDYFIENKGQFKPKQNGKQTDVIEYGVNHLGMIIHFHNNGFIWDLKKVTPSKKSEIKEQENEREAIEHQYTISEDQLRMNWIHSNANCKIIPESKSHHYFPCGTSEFNSYGYKKLQYKNLYNHIDAEYTFHKTDGIKYSLILNEGFNLNEVQFNYPNHKVTLINNKLTIETIAGNIEEKELLAYYEDGTPIKCSFTLKNQLVGFAFLENIDADRKIIIDPWVTPITTLTNVGFGNQCGFDVDYDYAGNLYVFGGADYGGANLDSKVAKYSPNGVLLWTFNGVLIAPAWSSGAGIGKISNFVVDKLNGKFYMGQGYNGSGAVITRYDANGNYDNFITTPNTNYEEVWEMSFQCSTGNILGFGGGTTTNNNLGLITPVGNFTMMNVTGSPFAFQDIVHSTISNSGELFVVMASGIDPSVNNVLIKVNNTLNGNIWFVQSGVSSFSEADNKPYLSFQASNGFNALSANKNYLYYYDGEILKAYSKATGAAVGNQFNLAGHILKFQGGNYADECDHIYVGGNNGNIKVFSFDGINFNSLPDIVIPGMTGKHIYDIKYNSGNNQLYISGEGFVSIQPRPQVCIDTVSLNANLLINCQLASVNLINGDTSSQYTYIWTDSATNTTIQTHSGNGKLSDTLFSVIPGVVYHVLVIKNALCGGASQTFNFTGSNTISINNNPVICQGQTYVVHGKTYTNTGIYIDTLQASTGCDTVIKTNLIVLPKLYYSQQIKICKGQQIVIDNHIYTTNGTYKDTVQSQFGCDSIITTILNVGESINLTQQAVLCNGNTFKVGNHVYSSNGIYHDTLISSFGCDSIITTSIKVDASSSESYYLPNAFSPNGDLLNDCFSLKHWPDLEKFSCVIYNRWGLLVYSSKSKNDCWNGFYNGRLAEIGTYFYYIKAKSACGEIIKKGDLNLLR